MATRTFADLSPYRRAVTNAQGTANLLDTILGGIQQGVQLQRLPQTLQSQDIAQQLQNAINLEKLNALQNPEQALARQIERELTLKGALNPDLGIIRAQPNLVGETIFAPAALTPVQQASLPSPDLLAMREVAANQAGIPIPEVVIPAATAGIPETPVSAFGIQTGLNVNPNIPIQAAEDRLDRQIQLANSRVRSSGVQGQFIPDGFGGMVFAQRPTTQGGEVVTTRVNTPEGEALRVAPRTSVSRGLTPNAQTTLLGQAAAAGVDVDSPKYFNESTGVYDFTQIAIDKGRAQRENKRLENASKASGLTGRTKTDIEALNAAERQLDTLRDEIAEIAKSGKTPSFLDDFVAVETAAPATGGFSQLWQRALRNLQSEESKVLEGRKSVVSSALTKAISGLAVTAQEATRLGFLPRAGDSFQDLIMKAGLVEDYINNQRAGLSGEATPAAAATTPPAGSGTTIGRFKLIGTR